MEEEIKKFEAVKNPFDPIDFTIFKEEVKDDFNNIISKISQKDKEKKALVISKYLFPRFFSIFTFQELLKKNFAESIYFLERCPQNIKEYQIVFLIPSKIECVELVSKQIEKEQEDMTEKQKNFQQNKNMMIEKSYFFLYVPKVDISVLNYIKDSLNYYDALFENYYDFELINFPLDYDIISLEDKQSFKELFLFKFSECVDNLANLLIKIEDIFGKIKNKYILGENSKIVSNLLEKKEKEGFLSEKNTNEILACFFIDRSVDYITPMCTEFTYEAMLHKFFGINFNKLRVKNEIAKIKKKEEKKSEEKKEEEEKALTEEEKKIKRQQELEREKKEKEEEVTLNLGYDDQLFHMIKSFNFDKLRTFLSKRFQYQEEMIKELKSGSKNNNTEKIRNDLILIKEMNSERPKLFAHINLANYIHNYTSLPRSKRRLQLEQSLLGGGKEYQDLLHDYYDTEMARKGEPYELLKLFCLENLVYGGIKGKIYDTFKNDFLLTYDESLFFLFKNLEELKIINKDGKSKLYQTLLDKLNLINFNLNVMQPTDISFVFGGYSPISIKLIEKALKGGWGAIYEKILKNMGCDCIFPSDEKNVMFPPGDNNYILLVFTGGITYAEIDAIRFLNKFEEFNKYKFLIITTNIINANSFFDEIKDDKIDLLIDESEIPKKPKESIEDKMDKKTLKKHKEREKEEQKKKEKAERAKQKAIEDKEKELAKDRAEYKKMKEKEAKKKK